MAQDSTLRDLIASLLTLDQEVCFSLLRVTLKDEPYLSRALPPGVHPSKTVVADGKCDLIYKISASNLSGALFSGLFLSNMSLAQMFSSCDSDDEHFPSHTHTLSSIWGNLSASLALISPQCSGLSSGRL